LIRAFAPMSTVGSCALIPMLATLIVVPSNPRTDPDGFEYSGPATLVGVEPPDVLPDPLLVGLPELPPLDELLHATRTVLSRARTTSTVPSRRTRTDSPSDSTVASRPDERPPIRNERSTYYVYVK
jgi:hypothetical protein